MKKNIVLVFFMVLFLNNCENSTGPGKKYSIDDMVGTWNILSENIDATMIIDLSVTLTSLDQESCLLLGGE